ncbi:unnamed protein product, partial [Dovyalis caffra]
FAILNFTIRKIATNYMHNSMLKKIILKSLTILQHVHFSEISKTKIGATEEHHAILNITIKTRNGPNQGG